jgi:hypothetical protein
MSHTKAFHCWDCDKDATGYMLKDDLWHQAWPTYDNDRKEAAAQYGKDESGKRNPMACLCLCFGCLEKRLGRRLTPLDFNFKSKLNEGILLGMRFETQSPRGLALAYQGGQPGVVTVELFEKWYDLFVTEENGAARPVGFMELEEAYRAEAAFRDHVPNPRRTATESTNSPSS